MRGHLSRREYLNLAGGFSVGVPRGFKGGRGQAAGPERGVSIPLSPDCEGVAVVFGEPNSLEWPTPEDGTARCSLRFQTWTHARGWRDASV